MASDKAPVQDNSKLISFYTFSNQKTFEEANYEANDLFVHFSLLTDNKGKNVLLYAHSILNSDGNYSFHHPQTKDFNLPFKPKIPGELPYPYQSEWEELLRVYDSEITAGGREFQKALIEIRRRNRTDGYFDRLAKPMNDLIDLIRLKRSQEGIDATWNDLWIKKAQAFAYAQRRNLLVNPDDPLFQREQLRFELFSENNNTFNSGKMRPDSPAEPKRPQNPRNSDINKYVLSKLNKMKSVLLDELVEILVDEMAVFKKMIPRNSRLPAERVLKVPRGESSGSVADDMQRGPIFFNVEISSVGKEDIQKFRKALGIPEDFHGTFDIYRGSESEGEKSSISPAMFEFIFTGLRNLLAHRDSRISSDGLHLDRLFPLLWYENPRLALVLMRMFQIREIVNLTENDWTSIQKASEDIDKLEIILKSMDKLMGIGSTEIARIGKLGEFTEGSIRTDVDPLQYILWYTLSRSGGLELWRKSQENALKNNKSYISAGGINNGYFRNLSGIKEETSKIEHTLQLEPQVSNDVGVVSTNEYEDSKRELHWKYSRLDHRWLSSFFMEISSQEASSRIKVSSILKKLDSSSFKEQRRAASQFWKSTKPAHAELQSYFLYQKNQLTPLPRLQSHRLVNIEVLDQSGDPIEGWSIYGDPNEEQYYLEVSTDKSDFEDLHFRLRLKYVFSPQDRSALLRENLHIKNDDKFNSLLEKLKEVGAISLAKSFQNRIKKKGFLTPPELVRAFSKESYTFDTRDLNFKSIPNGHIFETLQGRADANGVLHVQCRHCAEIITNFMREYFASENVGIQVRVAFGYDLGGPHSGSAASGHSVSILKTGPGFGNEFVVDATRGLGRRPPSEIPAAPTEHFSRTLNDEDGAADPAKLHKKAWKQVEEARGALIELLKNAKYEKLRYRRDFPTSIALDVAGRLMASGASSESIKKFRGEIERMAKIRSHIYKVAGVDGHERIQLRQDLARSFPVLNDSNLLHAITKLIDSLTQLPLSYGDQSLHTPLRCRDL